MIFRTEYADICQPQEASFLHVNCPILHSCERLLPSQPHRQTATRENMNQPIKIGYVFILVDADQPDRIILGLTEYLPQQVVDDYKKKTGKENISLEWFLALTYPKLAYKMIQYKLMPYKSRHQQDMYIIGIDTALSIFLKDIVEFFDIFQFRTTIHWRVGQLVTYQDLCAKTHIERMYPLLLRSYLRNKMAIHRRNSGKA